MASTPPAATGAGGAGGRGGEGRGNSKKQASEKKPPTIRKSCDFCNGRKKRCDGDGVRRCSYCIAKNNPDCIYSPRKPQRPRTRKQPTPATPPTATSPSTTATPPSPAGREQGPPPSPSTSPSPPSSSPQQEQQQKPQPPQQQQPVAACYDVIPRPSLKRVRLGASLATGIVGTKENTYLGDFFGCMGFLPLTCKSTVRDAMVKLLFAGASSPPLTSTSTSTWAPYPYNSSHRGGGGGGGGDGGWSLGGETGSIVKMEAGFDNTSGSIIAATATSPMLVTRHHQHHPANKSDPLACMFWCAVAIGGLTQGQPIGNMGPYIRLAESSLAGDVDVAVMPDVARAWTLMAYLFGFCGNSERFRECRRRAEKVFHLSDEEASADRSEFELLIQHAEGLDLFYGDGYTTPSHVRSYIKDPGPHPKMSDAATSTNMCQFVMQSYRRFGQAFFTDVLGNELGDNAKILRGAEDALEIEPEYMGLQTDSPPPTVAIEGAGVQNDNDNDNSLSALLCGDDDDDDDDGWGEQGRLASQERNLLVLRGDSALTPPAHGSTNMQRAMQDAIPEYERLHHAVDGPGVRGGIGGVMINCTSVVLKAAQGDIAGSVERISRCVEAMERYPGLIRFPMGLHISHLLMVFLANFEERGLYTRMMNVYNPMRPGGNQPIPPLEEWQGITGICSHVYCRAIETRFRKQQQQQQQQQQVQRQAEAPKFGGFGEKGCYTLGRGITSMPSTSSTMAMAEPTTAAAIASTSTGGCYGGGGYEQELEPYSEGCRDGRSENLVAGYWSHPIQVPPHSGDDASSDDHDGATMSKDLDPMVTLSDLGYSQELVTATAAATAAAAGSSRGRPAGGGGGGRGGGGGGTMAELPREGQGSTTPPSDLYHEVKVATGAFGSNASTSGSAAPARIEVEVPELEKGSSLSSLKAILDDDDDDDGDDIDNKDRDKDRCGSGDCGDLEGRDSADLPELASLETEDTLAAENFLESTFDMMEQRRVVG
eukprot:g13219.t1